ncbi:MAG: hypothetical protein IPJ15_07200 [Actinomycetales bacterium]|nr:hypothetical protein [Candidatus Phosphoribacter baldrii]HRC12248.1 hypothetical protein [Dermatophilaceae bacterium]
MPSAHLPRDRHHRRWPGPRPGTVAVFVVLVLLSTMSGCGSAGSSGGGGAVPPGGPTGGSPGQQVPPAPPRGAPAPLPEPPGAGIPTPTLSDPVPGKRLRQIPWRLVSADPGTQTVVVETVVGGIPCDRVTGVDVAETAASVTITVWAGPENGATGCDGPQPAMAQIVWVRVPLLSALGSRSVLPVAQT